MRRTARCVDVVGQTGIGNLSFRNGHLLGAKTLEGSLGLVLNAAFLVGFCCCATSRCLDPGVVLFDVFRCLGAMVSSRPMFAGFSVSPASV